MKHINKILYLFIAISVATLVSGCSLRKQTVEEPKVFTIWAFDDEDVWKPIIKDIQKELKGYEIKYVKKELNASYENDALNSILSGDGPDIWAIPSDWVYRHKGKLAPMPDNLAKDINLDEQFVPVIKEVGYFDDKIYTLSPTVDTLMVYYNPTLFDTALQEYNDSHKGSENSENRKNASRLLSQVPVTWSDFTETVKLLRKGNFDRTGVAVGTSDNILKHDDILYALMLQNGTEMTSADISTATFNLPQSTKAGANDNPTKRALDFYSSFADPNSPNYSWNSSMPQDIETFVNNRAAMIFGFDSLANYLAQIYPSFKYRKAPLPQIGGTNDTIKDYAKYTTFTVPNQSKSQDAAWQAIINLSVTNASSYASTVNISDSTKKKNFEPALIDREGNNNPGRVQNQMAATWTKGRFPIQADSIFSEAILNVANKIQNSQSALDLAASRVTELLRKSGW